MAPQQHVGHIPAPAVTLELHPHRSMQPSALQSCLYFTVGLALIPSALWAAIGLWGALPFALLELTFFILVLKLNARQSEDGQIIRIDESTITITTHQSDDAYALKLDRYWSRVRLFEDGGILIESKGSRHEVGRFLNDAQRRELGERLRQLIGRMGELPCLGNTSEDGSGERKAAR